MDILYYIGGGSMHNNNELRYSLRSLQKHCQDVERVWVVGNRPAFLKDVNYLWVEDKGQWWENAFNKTLAAIDAGISDKFLLMNDDFFMLDDFKAETYPAYYKGDMPEKAVNGYQEVIANTRKLLTELGKPCKHYGVHCPIVIEGEKYKQLKPYFTQPLSARCMYGNFFCQGKKASDCKGDEIKPSVTKCWSATPWAKDLMKTLAELFPQPSKWEKEDV